MKKRVLSILLAALMVVSLLPTVALATETAGLDNFEKVQTYTDGKFTDVKADDWFAKNVSTAYELNLMVGKSKDFFDTDSNLTVAEAMTIAARLRSIYYTGKAEFEQGDPWYQAYTDYCKANGIADPADYDMNKAITRGEFAEIFAKALPADALKKINTVQDNMIPDVKKTDKFGAAIYLLYRAGVLVGNDAKGTFAPDTNIKRVEVAAITTRMAQPALRESIRLVKPSSGGGSYTPPAPTTYTVTFDMQGHGTQIDPITNVASNAKITAPPAPSAAGWKFKGWYIDSDCATEWKFDTNTVTKNTILYAKWVEVKTVADILATDDSFPISDEKAWRADGFAKCYNNGNLYFESVKPTISLPLTTDAIGSDDDFICVDSNVTFTFKMTEGKLTAIVVSGSEGLDGTYAPFVPVTGISIDMVSATLSVGDNWLTLSVTFIPENVTNKSVIWSSSNTAVATVDASGKVTAIAFGTATITATTVDGGKTDTCEVTVSETKTVAEIMNTYAAAFPDSNANGWAESSSTHRMYYKDGALCIDNDTNIVLNSNNVAERQVGGYWYTDGTTTVIFSIDNGGTLTSIQYSSPNDGQSQYNGVYTAPTYTVTFNMQEHGGQITDISNVSCGSKIQAPTAPTATGYTFGGWYKEAECTHAWNFDTDIVTADTTLYAEWTKWTTIADILATVDNFPRVAYHSGPGSYDVPKGAWVCDNEKSVAFIVWNTSNADSILRLQNNSTYAFIALSTEITEGENHTFSASSGLKHLTFTIESDKLASFTFSTTAEDQTNVGTYTAPSN